MAEGEVPGDYIIERQDLHDTFFLVGSEKKERISTIKYFLVNYSPYFRAMLLDTDMRERFSKEDIEVPDHEPDVFQLMLRYVYGEQNLQFIDVDQAMRFHLLVDKCLMPKLMAVSSKYLIDNCKENICDVLKCAAILNIKEIEPRALEMLQAEIKSFLASKDFELLDKAVVMFILQQNNLVVEEIHLWQALLKWTKHQLSGADEGTIREKMGNMLNYVRFLAMSQVEFAENVVKASILTLDEVISIFIALSTGKTHGLKYLSEEKERLPIGSVMEFQ